MNYFIILLNFGLCLALQHPLEYAYEYEASVSTGMPEIHSQMSAFAVKGIMKIQMQKDGSAYVKYEDIQRADFNGEADCNSEFPGDFQPSPGHVKDQVDVPFLVNLFNGKDIALETAKDEILSLTNMKKAVIGALRNEFLNGNFEALSGNGTIANTIKEGYVPQVFTTKEETVFGICQVRYTAHKIPELLATNFNSKDRVEIDVQSGDDSPAALKSKSKTSKTSKSSKKYSSKGKKGKPAKLKLGIPKLEKDLWHVVRSIDFDHCDESVYLQHTPVGMNERLDGSLFPFRRSRSSVSEFILRGSGGAFRVEDAEIKGSISVNAFKDGEMMQSLTKMKLSLVSVEEIKIPFKPSTDIKQVATWMQQVYSPYDAPTTAPPIPWMIYTGKGEDMSPKEMLTGYEVTQEELEWRKDFVKQTLEYYVSVLMDMDGSYNGNPEENMKKMVMAKRFTGSLHQKHLEYLEKHFMLDAGNTMPELIAKDLLLNLLTTSGSPAATRMTLKYLKDGNLTTIQQAITFLNIFQNQESPAMITEIMDHILSRDFDDKFITSSIALLNLANALRHFCTKPQASSIYYMGQIYRDVHCRGPIKEKLGPFIKDLLKKSSSSTSLFRKIVGIMTLTELRSPIAIELLAPLVDGITHKDTYLSLLALRGFQRWHLPESAKNQAMTFLLEKYSDRSLRPIIRSRALYAYATWAPDPQFWYTLARLSWTEPAKDVAYFSVELIKAAAANQDEYFARSSQAAALALKIARPIAPSLMSKFSSFNFGLEEDSEFEGLNAYFLRKYVEKQDKLSYQESASLKGFIQGLFKMMLTINSEHFFPSVNRRNLDADSLIQKTVASNLYDQIQETIGAEKIKSDYGFDQAFVIYARAYQHMHFLFTYAKGMPTRYQTSELNMAPLHYLRSDTEKMIYWNIAAYMHPLEGALILPTEIGTPTYSNMAHSMTLSSNSKLTTQSMDINHNVFKIQSQFVGSIRVFAGPMNIRIGTESRSTMQLNIPIGINNPYKSGSLFDLASAYIQPFCPLIAQSTPRTILAPLVFSKNHGHIESKIIQSSEPDENRMQFSPLGYHLDLLWKSQMPSPLLLMKEPTRGISSVFEALTSSTSRRWQFEILIDPVKSKTKSIGLYANLNWYIPIEKDHDDDDGQVSGQTSGQEYDYGQLSQTSGGGGAQNGEFDDLTEALTPHKGSSDDFGQDVYATPIANGDTNIFEDLHKHSPLRDTFVALSLNDAIKDVREKLKPYGKKLNTFDSMSIRLNDINSGYTQYGFYFINYDETSSPTRKQSIFRIMLLKETTFKDETQAKICIEGDIRKPVIAPLATLEEILSSKLSSDAHLAVTLNCEDPVVYIKREALMSEKAKTDFAKRTLEGCSLSRDNDLFRTLRYSFIIGTDKFEGSEEGIFIYNDINYNIRWHPIQNSAPYPLTSKVIDFLGFTTSLVTGSDVCDNQDMDGNLAVNFHRCHHYDEWYVGVGNKPPALINKPFMNFNLDYLNSFVKASEVVDYAPPGFIGKCFISSDQVRNFDGFFYEFNPTDCWTVAAMDCLNEDHFMVLVRKSASSNIPEVRYISKTGALVIDITSDVKVNGKVIQFYSEKEEIKDDNDKVFVTLYKKDDRFLIDIDDIEIAILDKVIIQVDKNNYKGITCGLCGNCDSHSELDMLGPHNCHYSDPKLLAAAWTGPSDKCDLYTLLSIREEVEEYQKSCKKIESFYQKDKDNHTHSGLIFEWSVHQESDGYNCVSQTLIGHCKVGFKDISQSPTNIGFDCYQEDMTPSKLSDAINSGLTYTSHAIEGHPCKIIEKTVNLPDSCR